MDEKLPGWTVGLPKLKVVIRDCDRTAWIVLGEIDRRAGICVFMNRWTNEMITDVAANYHLPSEGVTY